MSRALRSISNTTPWHGLPQSSTRLTRNIIQARIMMLHDMDVDHLIPGRYASTRPWQCKTAHAHEVWAGGEDSQNLWHVSSILSVGYVSWRLPQTMCSTCNDVANSNAPPSIGISGARGSGLTPATNGDRVPPILRIRPSMGRDILFVCLFVETRDTRLKCY